MHGNAIPVVRLTCGLLAGSFFSGADARAQANGADFYHDFRGHPLPAELAPYGEASLAVLRRRSRKMQSGH